MAVPHATWPLATSTLTGTSAAVFAVPQDVTVAAPGDGRAAVAAPGGRAVEQQDEQR